MLKRKNSRPKALMGLDDVKRLQEAADSVPLPPIEAATRTTNIPNRAVCGNCRFFEPVRRDPEGVSHPLVHPGNCHRYPQILPKSPGGWCGEFQNQEV